MMEFRVVNKNNNIYQYLKAKIIYSSNISNIMNIIEEKR